MCHFKCSNYERLFPNIVKIVQDYCPDPKRYYHFTSPMERSEPKIPLEVLHEATKPVSPYPWNEEPDMNLSDVNSFLDFIVAIVFRIFKLKANWKWEMKKEKNRKEL